MSNLEFAASTLMEADLAKGRQPDVCDVTFSLSSAMAEVLGQDAKELWRPVAEAVLKVAQSKLKPPPTLTAEDIVQRNALKDTQLKDPPPPKQIERRKSCLIS